MTKKKFILCFSLFFGVTSIAQTNKTKLFKVSGKVTQTFAYCGGMAPTPEMVDEHARPKPYKGKTFYIKNGKTNDLKQPVLLKVVADSLGNFTFNLPAGNYSFIQAEQVKAIKYIDYTKNQNVICEKSCLLEWWKTPYYQFEIKDKNIEGLAFVFHHACFVYSDIPCIQYIGPMPP